MHNVKDINLDVIYVGISDALKEHLLYFMGVKQEILRDEFLVVFFLDSCHISWLILLLSWLIER